MRKIPKISIKKSYLAQDFARRKWHFIHPCRQGIVGHWPCQLDTSGGDLTGNQIG